MPIRSQGTELFYVRPGSTPAVVKLFCPTGITGLGGAGGQIDTTCLSNTKDKTFVRGLGEPGPVTAPVNFEPEETSHQDMFDLKESGDTVQWIIGLSDGTSLPTLDSNDDLVPAAGRSFIQFSGYVADWALDIASNDIVKGTLSIQRSGSAILTPKA